MNLRYRQSAVSRRSFSFAALVSVAVALSVGCATGNAASPAPDADRAALLQRANAYWAAIKADDRLTAWNYEAASKDPKATLQDYLQRSSVVFNRVQVQEVRSLVDDLAVVDVLTVFSVPVLRMKNEEAITPDEWRRIDGVWYHVLKRSVMFSNGS